MLAPPINDVVVDEETVKLQIGMPQQPRIREFTLQNVDWETRTYWNVTDNVIVLDLIFYPNRVSTMEKVHANMEAQLVLAATTSTPVQWEKSFDGMTKSVRVSLPLTEFPNVDPSRANSRMQAMPQMHVQMSSLPSWVAQMFVMLRIRVNKAFPERGINSTIDFTNPNSNSDRILVVDGKSLHVHSQVLGVFSSYFERMFYGNFDEAKAEKIVLEDVDYGEIVELLNAIYPTQHPITTTNVASLLSLSNRFDVKSVFIKCEAFLLKSESASNIDKFQQLDWASRYFLPQLQDKILKSLVTFDDVCQAEKSPAWPQMCEEAKTALLLSVFRIGNKTGRHRGNF